jgi:uncharacterized tellurite resistance protein B-like protein
MIIFGTRGIRSTLSRGTFHCPICRLERSYKKKNLRKWGHIYWIPIIPMGDYGTYVECDSCNNTFKEEVLTLPPPKSDEEVRSEYMEGVKLAMIHMILADGKIEDSEIDAMKEVFTRITSQYIGRTEIMMDLDTAQKEKDYVFTKLRELKNYINASGIVLILKAAYEISAADGEVHPDELTLLAQMARTMGLRKSEYEKILDALQNPQPA